MKGGYKNERLSRVARRRLVLACLDAYRPGASQMSKLRWRGRVHFHAYSDEGLEDTKILDADPLSEHGFLKSFWLSSESLRTLDLSVLEAFREEVSIMSRLVPALGDRLDEVIRRKRSV